jgi:hypothetical protein
MQKKFGVLLAFFALALAACSGGGSTSNPLSLSGLVISSPSPTPVPTVAPTATATPNNALKDGDFESGAFNATAGWSACSIAHPNVSSTAVPSPTPVPAIATASTIGAVYVSATSAPFQGNPTPMPSTTPAIFAGKFSALAYAGTGAQTVFENVMGTSTGATGANGICQTVVVPASASLTMFVNEGGTDGWQFDGTDQADQEADIIPTTGANAGSVIRLFAEDNNPKALGNAEPGSVPSGETSTAGGNYVEKGPYLLTAAPYNLTAGQTVQLFIGAFDSDPSTKFGVYLFVDDVNLTGPSVPASLQRTTPMNRMSLK